MKLLLAVATVVSLTANPLHAQQTGPYAAGQVAYVRELLNKEMNREADDLLYQIRRLFYAAGCNVVPKYKAQSALMRQEEWFVHRWTQSASSVLKSRRQGAEVVHALNLKQRIEEARLAGLAEAGDNCAYWKDHPEAVHAVRSTLR